MAQIAEDVCKLTHYDSRCVGSCVIVSEIISQFIWRNKELNYQEIIEIGNKYDNRIAEYVNLAQNSDLSVLSLDEEGKIGYTLKCLSAALWCLFHAHSFKQGLLAIVNEGGDADTNAAVACAVLGAKFGYQSIPIEYIEGLSNKRILIDIIENILSLDIMRE